MQKAQHIDSYYATSVSSFPEHPTLEESIKKDVCVIGGGFAGLSAALHLAERGYRVVLLESKRVSWGASGRNGGHMETLFVHNPDNINKVIGAERARQMWDLSSEANILVKDIITQNSIDCDMKQGVGFAALKPSHAKKLYKGAERFRAVCNRENIIIQSKSELADMISTDIYHGGVFDMDMVHLNPLQFALGIADTATKAGVQIYENSPALSYQADDKVTIKTPSGEVEADYCVLACNANIRHLESKLASYLINFKAWMIATDPLDPERAKSLIKNDVAVNDTRTFINFFRISGDYRIVFGSVSPIFLEGTENIKSTLQKRLLTVYPQLSDLKVDYAWQCVGALSMKNLPHIGCIAPNVLFSQGSNVSWSIMNGKLIAEAISGNPDRYDIVANISTPRIPIGHNLRVVLGNTAKAFERLHMKISRL